MRVDLVPGEDTATAVRAIEAESVALVAGPGLDTLAQAVFRASIGPLAIERAPGGRVNAVLVGEGSAEADVKAAVAFLEGARSTTGQVLEVS